MITFVQQDAPACNRTADTFEIVFDSKARGPCGYWIKLGNCADSFTWILILFGISWHPIQIYTFDLSKLFQVPTYSATGASRSSLMTSPYADLLYEDGRIAANANAKCGGIHGKPNAMNLPCLGMLCSNLVWFFFGMVCSWVYRKSMFGHPTHDLEFQIFENSSCAEAHPTAAFPEE